MVKIGKDTVIIAWYTTHTHAHDHARVRVYYILSIYYNIYIIYIR